MRNSIGNDLIIDRYSIIFSDYNWLKINKKERHGILITPANECLSFIKDNKTIIVYKLSKKNTIEVPENILNTIAENFRDIKKCEDQYKKRNDPSDKQYSFNKHWR